jgi:hypothetical protein
MHAQCAHSPPTSRSSTSATVRPWSASRPEAPSPAGPPPTTTASKRRICSSLRPHATVAIRAADHAIDAGDDPRHEPGDRVRDRPRRRSRRPARADRRRCSRASARAVHRDDVHRDDVHHRASPTTSAPSARPSHGDLHVSPLPVRSTPRMRGSVGAPGRRRDDRAIGRSLRAIARAAARRARPSVQNLRNL